VFLTRGLRSFVLRAREFGGGSVSTVERRRWGRESELIILLAQMRL